MRKQIPAVLTLQPGIAARLRSRWQLKFALLNRPSQVFTANSAALEYCSEMTSANAVSLSATPEDGWYLISPTGTFPEPNGEYVQVFGLQQAQEVVSTFNSFTGRVARQIKNLWHGAGFTTAIPVFEGHSDRDAKLWPTMNRLADITDLRADEEGLWGMTTWNAANLANRTQEIGSLKPSPVYWHGKADEAGQVFPALLESVGLVRFPNITAAPAWTANAAPTPFLDNQNTQNPMNEEQLKQLRKALGTSETATVEDLLTIAGTANAAVATLAEKDTALNTANSAKDGLQNQVTTLTTANASLKTETETLRTGLLDVAEKRGIITPAERPDFETRMTANAAPVLVELKDRKPAMNTTSIEINGTRHDLSTANSRQAVITSAVEKRMADDKCDYDTAFARVKTDPTYAGVFNAMPDPTRKS